MHPVVIVEEEASILAVLFLLELHIKFYSICDSKSKNSSCLSNDSSTSHCKLSICSYVHKIGQICLDPVTAKTISINGAKGKGLVGKL